MSSRTGQSGDDQKEPGRALALLDSLSGAGANLGIALSAAFILIVMTLGAVDVVGTAFFSQPLPAAVEFSSYSMVLIIFGAFAYCQRRQEHVRVDIIVRRLPERIQYVLRLISLIAGAVVFAVLAWRSWPLLVYSVGIRETAAAIYPFPVWPFKVGAFGALCFATLEFVRQVIFSLAGREKIVESSSTEEAV